MNDIDYYLSMPWTIQREEHDDDGRYFALTVDELPGFVVASEDEAELDEMFWSALRAFLDSYLQHNETPPIPRAARIAVVERRRAERRAWAFAIARTGEAEIRRPDSVSTSGYIKSFSGRLMPAAATV